MLPLRTTYIITLAALLSSCGKQEEEAVVPAPPPESVASAAAVMLRGDFDIPDGSTLKVTETLSIEDASILQRSGEKEITGRMTVSQSERQRITFFEDGTREIQIGEGGSTLTTSFDEGQPTEETTPDKLTGKTLIGRQQPDGVWTYKVKGESGTAIPVGFAAANLRSDELYPTDWKEFGETWSPEPAALSALLGPGFQINEGKIEMRALSYAKRNGQPCAEVAATINAKGVFRSGQSRQDISLKLKGKFFRSLHLYQDLEANLSGTIEMYERQGNLDVRIEGPISFRREAVWEATKDADPAPTL